MVVRVVTVLSRLIALAVVAGFLGSAQAAVDKVTSSTRVPLATPSEPIPTEALLDLGVTPLSDGLELTDESDTVFPEVRYAESIYFSNQLAKTLEKSGAWGAVRVIPSRDVVVDLYVTGTILESDGETMALEITAFDSSGKQWFSREYSQVVGKYAYDRRLKNMGDPFQNLYTRIANDLLAYRESLSEKQALDLRTISRLRFARAFSPAAFDDYLAENRKGVLAIERLPAENDSILQRVQKIRERDYLYIDTMQDYYDHFSERMHVAYQDFRRESYDSVVRARQLNELGQKRIIAGIGAIIAGIYGRLEGGNSAVRDVSTVTAASGGILVKSGLDKKQEAAAYNESISELGASLESEIAPQVIELEDRTVTLTGTVAAQYEQWKAILQDIYKKERGEL